MAAERIVTFDELKEHTKKESVYILIHEKVYDVTKFIDEHPGGDEVILAEAGKDATEAFEDVGHSDESRELLPAMFVGNFEKGSALKTKAAPKAAAAAASTSSAVEQGSNAMYIFPLAALGAYFGWRFYTTGQLV